jgi:hypothetical protein
MNLLNNVGITLFGIVGLLGPPAFLGLAWRRRFQDAQNLQPRWRRVLRDAAVAGTTVEFAAFWIVVFVVASISNHDFGRAVDFWFASMRVLGRLLVAFVAIALIGKGKGRLLTILGCVSLFLGIVVFDAMR